MKITTKFGSSKGMPVSFEHEDTHTGEVKISKGSASLSVSMLVLRDFVAEGVRLESIDALQKMKPADLLKRVT